MKYLRYQTRPHYNLAASYTNLCDEMDRLFNQAVPAGGDFDPDELRADLFQNKEAFVIRAELPDFRKEDVSVEVVDGILTISGHRKTEATSDSAEKATGSSPEHVISRVLSLPDDIDTGKIHAAYENGVLTVTLPKNEKEKPRQIAVQVK